MSVFSHIALDIDLMLHTWVQRFCLLTEKEKIAADILVFLLQDWELSQSHIGAHIKVHKK